MNSPKEADDSRLVYEVPEAGALLGLNRNASYQAAKRGDIPTIRIGKLIRVPRAAFHTKFGLSGSATDAATREVIGKVA
jgi:excisionase family DNA binding protein